MLGLKLNHVGKSSPKCFCSEEYFALSCIFLPVFSYRNHLPLGVRLGIDNKSSISKCRWLCRHIVLGYNTLNNKKILWIYLCYINSYLRNSIHFSITWTHYMMMGIKPTLMPHCRLTYKWTGNTLKHYVYNGYLSFVLCYRFSHCLALLG